MKIDVQKLEYLRMLKMWTQQELADTAGISRATVSAIVFRGTCSKPTLFKLAKALEVDPVDLLQQMEFPN